MTDPFAPVAVEPSSIVIGNHYSWTVGDDLDPTLFAMSVAFVSGAQVKSLAASNASGVWTFEATGAFTADLAHGRVTVDVLVTRLSDGAVRTIRTFDVQCFSNDADRRSHARLMVDKIESILAGRADNDVDSYSIKSRQITKMSVKELTDWREYYLAELGREVNPITGKRKSNNTVKVGFV